MSVPRILVIAGSDSGGGAGIQADIKTVTMLGGHAMTAITAITAQNTLGVTDVHSVPTASVVAQIDAVVADIGVDAVKIGMIGSADIVDAVIDRLAPIPGVPVVLDPVMVATSGARLADDRTVAALERLMAVSSVVTPNAPELSVLTGDDVSSGYSLERAARKLSRRHGTGVLAKGGHVPGGTVTDILVEAGGATSRFADPRIDSPHTHGTGCTLATAVAVALGEGRVLADAVARARQFVRVAILEAPGLGAGHGPMGHGRVRLDLPGDTPVQNQVTLPVTALAEATAFYELLGLRRIVHSPDRYARFEAGSGTTLSLEAAHEIGGQALTYLECDNLDAAVARLAAAGVSIESGPADRRWGWREARLRDPAGNAICLYAAGPARRFPPWRER
ncbi:hydroxymethylpyrimidine/phosphomethylpyrimidine kinase [Sphingomonas jejuensis]|uniref:hydroxymethylpyrimidine kinase n=1 Tax=Sphingomonas jejuensis TaxID=904715 RepID=A0ABX0XLH5_9SPHN|nr:bifunctional hydroxymethylpyrimidine kinase/phosphomethylpyrimidine kinase [Sphingomonas jejuensis]NJC34090.1 hydroxymethylpyrimidine/phosphomethylpyrimidine kinase [Sphingomonas jejuensis]